MKSIKSHAKVSLVLCALVVIGSVFSFLALSDIYHGIEPDLSAEWWVIKITFFLVGALVLSTFSLSMKMIKNKYKKDI